MLSFADEHRQSCIEGVRLLQPCYSKILNAGMETYTLQSNKQGLEMRQHFSHTVTWWKYSPEARLLLLGTLDKNMWIQVCTS